MKKRDQFLRIAAVLLCGLLLFTLLFSTIFVSFEADHECEGEHCHICETIEKCEAFLHEMRNTVSYAIAVAFGTAFVLALAGICAWVSVRPTPVSRKVQMNN
ncbi:MAG: hypothetical protein J5379_02980 [Clostridiales bacterium]|nr:hypothetical protein [Clostridiales bacterium]